LPKNTQPPNMHQGSNSSLIMLKVHSPCVKIAVLPVLTVSTGPSGGKLALEVSLELVYICKCCNVAGLPQYDGTQPLPGNSAAQPRSCSQAAWCCPGTAGKMGCRLPWKRDAYSKVLKLGELIQAQHSSLTGAAAAGNLLTLSESHLPWL
jgi:hypothetical protein